jgi:hypothetical protein
VTGLTQMLVIASLLSGVAVTCLLLMPDAPPRVRFRLAIAGLAAWAVPWPVISISVELPAAVVGWRDAVIHAVPLGPTTQETPAVDVYDSAALRAPPAAGGVSHGAYLFLALLLPGVIRFAFDVRALRAAAAAWLEDSRSGDALRASQPVELRRVRASIRVVRGSSVAATTGWCEPTVWLGDRLGTRDRRVALAHELWHVRRRDSLSITFVTAMRRAYWWNPAVSWLCREAVLMMESDCDRHCAQWFGAEYAERLAAMMLDASAIHSPRLAAHARNASLNVRRLQLLERGVRLRRRDRMLIVLLSSGAAVTAAHGLIVPRVPSGDGLPYEAQPEDARGASSRSTLPNTPAARALQELLDAYNAGDVERLGERLGAFTPQEIEFRVPPSTDALELVAITRAEGASIEFVVRGLPQGIRRAGMLEIDIRDETRIARVEMRK